MIVRFFKSGISRGEAPVNYVLGDKDHQGTMRTESPEVLAGNPQLTVDLINGIQRKHKYASGCLAFRPEEQLTRDELHQILQKFKSTVAPGLSPDSIDCLFVLHHEAPDKKTGLAGFHVHFIIPMVRLDEKHLGNRWNPHPPGQESIELISMFTSTTNHEMGWKQVTPNPLRVNLDNFWKKVEGKPATRKAKLLEHELKIAVATGAIKSRDELCSFMTDNLSMTITRKGNDYISVKFPGGGKAMRLKGPLFDVTTNYERLASPNSHKFRSVVLTDLEYQTHKDRLSHLFQKRGQLLTGSPINIPIPKITINPEENNNGRVRIREKTGGADSTGTAHRRHGGTHLQQDRTAHNSPVPHPIPLRQNRTQLKSIGSIPARKDNQIREITQAIPRGGLTGGGLAGWRNSNHSTNHESGAQTGNQPRFPNAQQRADLEQNSGNEKSTTKSPNNISTNFFKLGATAEEINEQLRVLGIALSDASYEEQSAIQQQINQLVGRKEHLPRPR